MNRNKRKNTIEIKDLQSKAAHIEEKLLELADTSRVNGEIWRAAYTKEYTATKIIVKKWMQEAGLHIYEDSVGNIFGRAQGYSDGVILAGSHLDTVKNGGLYDGAAGIAIAVSAVKELLTAFGQPKKTIEVVALLEEEGSRYGSSFLGSKAIVGLLNQKELLEKDENGILLSEAMQQAGYNPEKFGDAKRNDLEAFVELHIEQGPILDQNKLQIGIVKNIVGLISYEVIVKGSQNHAGTTPMQLRLDPVSKVAMLICEMIEKATDISGTATLTVGKINAFPGISNVIANEVHFSIDLREGNVKALKSLEQSVLKSIKQIEQSGFTVSFERRCNEMPIALDQRIIGLIEQAVSETSRKAIKMNSGAGHDAQIFARFLPVGMIFIPSKHGISHSPEEYTPKESLQDGLSVMFQVLKKLVWG